MSAAIYKALGKQPRPKQAKVPALIRGAYVLHRKTGNTETSKTCGMSNGEMLWRERVREGTGSVKVRTVREGLTPKVPG